MKRYFSGWVLSDSRAGGAGGDDPSLKGYEALVAAWFSVLSGKSKIVEYTRSSSTVTVCVVTTPRVSG